MVEGGYLYVAQNPLYRVTIKGHHKYFRDEEAYNAYVRKQTATLFSLSVDYLSGDSETVDDKKMTSIMKKAPEYITAIKKIAGETGLDRDVVEHLSLWVNSVEPGSEGGLDEVKEVITNTWPNLTVEELEGGFLHVEGPVEEGRFMSAFISPDTWEILRPVYDLRHSLSVSYAGYTPNKEGGEFSDWMLPSLALEEMLGQATPKQRLRMKGLGEMMPNELWDTAMDPVRRTLLRVTVEDAELADNMFMDLMGKNPECRKTYLESTQGAASNVDI
jgi:DNA gyrase/topoisomerase IV subunit B